MKIKKKILICCILFSSCFIKTYAQEEIYTVIFNDINKEYKLKLGEIIPNPEYTKELEPDMEFRGWYNSDGFVVGSEIVDIDGIRTIIFNPIIQKKDNIEEKPEEKPPVKPIEKYEYETIVTNNDIILNLKDVNLSDLFQLANVNITQTKKTLINDEVVKVENIIPKIKVKQEIIPVISKQQLIFNLSNSNKDYIINVNVVSDDYILNEEKSHGMLLKNKKVKITQKEAKKIKTKIDLINLHQISAINVKNEPQEIGILEEGNINQINQGIVGEYEVKYGILSKIKTPFLVNAKIIVEKDEEENELTNIQMPLFDDTVSQDELILENNNQKIIQEEKLIVNNTGVDNHKLLLYLVIILMLKITIKKKKRKKNK